MKTLSLGVDLSAGVLRYAAVPPLLAVWSKDEPSKLGIAHDLLLGLHDTLIGVRHRPVLCDSWSP